MHRLWRLIVAAMLGGISQAALAQQTDQHIIKSVYAMKDIKLDPNPNSAFWREAHTVYADSDPYGRSVTGYRTEIKSRWTSRNLYVLFVCPFEELYLKKPPRKDIETRELWDWDVAELFIGSDFKTIQLYKEFEVSPQGEWTDLNIDSRLPHHETGWTWNSGFIVRARIDARKKIWYGAMSIPFASIDSREPRSGNLFRVNFFRSQGPPKRRVAIAWRAPMSDTFHEPARFGQLELTSK